MSSPTAAASCGSAVRARLASKPVLSLSEVAKHKTADDCWLIFGGVVFDVSSFLADHPGGPEVVLNAAGRDATDEFEEISHSMNAREMANKFEIGILEGHEATATGTEKPPPKRNIRGLNNSQSSTTAIGGFGVVPFLFIGAIAVAAYFLLPMNATTGVQQA
eukprot:GHVS01009558.1.p1 GENE.GHVS01009558.1~~GHVS01009558.1.p1  ORF type:complete len:162 (+),score=30.54 GHVS01009558.1:167-652(+)